MFVIVGMLFTFSASAATVLITPDSYTPSSGEVSTSTSKFINGFVEWEVEATAVHSEVNQYALFEVFFKDESGSTSIGNAKYELFDGSSIVSAGGFGTTSGFWFKYLLETGVSYTLSIFGDAIVLPTFANVKISAIPVPAALFLFAPALLGFFGLRRKAKAKAVA